MFRAITHCSYLPSLNKSSDVQQNIGNSKHLVEVWSLLHIFTHSPHNRWRNWGLDSLRSFCTDTKGSPVIRIHMYICFLWIQCFCVSTRRFPKRFTHLRKVSECRLQPHAVDTCPPLCVHWGWSRVGYDLGWPGLWAWWSGGTWRMT